MTEPYIISQICDLFNQVNDLPTCPRWARTQLKALAEIPEEESIVGGVEMVLLLCMIMDAPSLASAPPSGAGGEAGEGGGGSIPAWIRMEARRLAATASNPYFQAAQTIKREIAALCVRRARSTKP